MSEDIRSLARNSLAAFSHEVSDDYTRLREMFNGAVARRAIDGYVYEQKQADANHELLRQFAALLPQAEKTLQVDAPKWIFTTKDPAEAKILQKSLVWPYNRMHSAYPYYMIGRKPQLQGAGFLLLAALHDNDLPQIERKSSEYYAEKFWQPPGLYRGQTTAKSLTAYDRQVQEHFSNIYTDEELSSPGFFDYKSETFTVAPESPGSIKLGEYYARRPKDRIYNLGKTSLRTQLPAEEFLAYDVFGSMCDLAERFRVVSQTDLLLEKSLALSELPKDAA